MVVLTIDEYVQDILYFVVTAAILKELYDEDIEHIHEFVVSDLISLTRLIDE